MSLLVIFIPLVLVRWSRWLAIVQQKEYRLDRLTAYVRSGEGMRECWRVVPRLGDFTRKGFKRPKLTARILVIWLLSAIPVIWFLWLLPSLGFTVALMWEIIGYCFLPVVIFIAVVPSYLISETITMFVLYKAGKLVTQSHPRVIGITGSYGKTSTKLLLAHVLRGKYTVFSTPKSFNQRYSVAKAVLDGYQGQQFMVLEYAAYKTGEIKELAGYIQPDWALITGLAYQHLSTFGSVDNIIKAKSELVSALKDKSAVFYNGRDAGTLKIAKAGGALRPVDYTAVEGLRADLSDEGELRLEWKNHKLKTRLVGMHYLGAVAAVITVCSHLGLGEREIVAGLASFQPGENFVRTKILKNGALLLDDGRTANPVGVRAALNLLQFLQKTRRTAHSLMIFGGIIDLAGKTAETHSELAVYARDIVDEVLYTGIDGVDEFRQVFGERLTAGEEQVVDRLKHLNPHTVILLEGYIPKKYETYLQ
ncbi:MAG: Mur ligase family protein [Candidatus Colwellbacteria bacterium]|nr:Mur ligase family protein [Candidatus Colwellbacteria bacterium]